MLDLTTLLVVDQHCHPWRRPTEPYTAETYRPLFTEGVDPRTAVGVPASIYYRWVIRELARVLECEPREEAVLEARASLGHPEIARKLMAEAKIEAAVIDAGFVGRGADLFTVEEMGVQLGGAVTVEALRLETLLETLVADAVDAGEVEDRFRARLNRSAFREARIVALKSIIAYRSGLAIARADQARAFAAFGPLKAAQSATGGVRIGDKTFLDYFLGIALAWANDEHFPFQFHTGFGDPDVFLPTGNPVMLRDVLQDERYRDVPLVLLHAGWPYVRESSYLASVYPNVYLDLGLAIPFAATEYGSIVRQALALAPSTRVLYSSDGFAVPEHCWFAAVHGRRAIASVLGDLVALGAIGQDEAREMAGQILRDNARRLYGLDGRVCSSSESATQLS